MENKWLILDKIVKPRTGSNSLQKYTRAKNSDLQLFHLVIDTVLTSDYSSHIAEQALEGREDYKLLTPGDLASKKPGKRTQALRKSSQQLLEMFISRAIDNFQIYLVDIIRAVLNQKPEILSARKQELSVSHILKFKTVEDLIKDIIETKIASLSYDGFGEIQEWCIDKGIPLEIPNGFKSDIIELIALRNIIVHNRGCIDFKYIKSAGKSNLKIGEKFKLNTNHLFDSFKLLDAVVFLTDEAIVSKFKMETEEIE
jgi:hypothetical protein